MRAPVSFTHIFSMFLGVNGLADLDELYDMPDF